MHFHPDQGTSEIHCGQAMVTANATAKLHGSGKPTWSGACSWSWPPLKTNITHGLDTDQDYVHQDQQASVQHAKHDAAVGRLKLTGVFPRFDNRTWNMATALNKIMPA